MIKKPFLLTVAIVLLYSVLFFTGIFDFPRLRLNDLCYELRYNTLYKHQEDLSRGRVAAITFDDETFEKIKERWPWKRDLTSQLIDNISSAKPKVIVADIAFLGESDPETDILLLNSLKKAGNVLLASFLSEKGEYIRPFGPLARVSLGLGVVNKPRDKDLIVRRSRAFVLEDNKEIADFSLPIKSVAAYYDIPFSNIQHEKDKIIIKNQQKDIQIPVHDHDATFNINFIGKKDNFIRIPVWKVLNNTFDKSLIKDKIVLLGVEAEIMHDIYNTSLGTMSGLVGNANEITMILDDNYMKDIPVSMNFIFTVLIGLLLGAIVSYLGIWWGLLFVAMEISFSIFTGIFLFFRGYQSDLFSLPFLSVVIFLGVNFYKSIRVFFENIKLQELAITDSLTGLYLRRYSEVRLDHEVERFKRYRQNLSFLMIDIDHFKKINDSYGHQQGDAALKAVAETIKHLSRKVDVPSRYGGEEFAIILPDTPAEGAQACAEKMRAAIEQKTIPGIKSKITISIGVATLGMASEKGITKGEELVSAADSALYKAKEQGRNRVVVATAK